MRGEPLGGDLVDAAAGCVLMEDDAVAPVESAARETGRCAEGYAEGDGSTSMKGETRNRARSRGSSRFAAWRAPVRSEAEVPGRVDRYIAGLVLEGRRRGTRPA